MQGIPEHLLQEQSSAAHESEEQAGDDNAQEANVEMEGKLLDGCSKTMNVWIAKIQKRRYTAKLVCSRSSTGPA